MQFDTENWFCCHGNQWDFPPPSVWSRLRTSLFLKLLKINSRVLIAGVKLLMLFICLFPNRPIGLTPRPTYQKGSISGSASQRKKFTDKIHYCNAIFAGIPIRQLINVSNRVSDGVAKKLIRTSLSENVESILIPAYICVQCMVIFFSLLCLVQGSSNFFFL